MFDYAYFHLYIGKGYDSCRILRSCATECVCVCEIYRWRWRWIGTEKGVEEVGGF